MSKLNDILLSLFILYCLYALYACFVSFYRPGDPGEIFSRLRIPPLIFFYFLLPCVALFVLHRAFWHLKPGCFWGGAAFIVPISFFIIVYFVTSPDWPIGRVLAVHMVPRGAMRFLLSLNFTVCLLVVIICAITLVRLPSRLNRSPDAKTYDAAIKELDKAEEEQEIRRAEVNEIRSRTISEILKEFTGLLGSLVAILSAIASFLVSWKALGGG